MSKRAKAKRISPYRQRAIDPLGGLRTLSDRQPINDDQITDLAIGYWLAFDNMVLRDSTGYDWNIIAGSINIAIVMCEDGITEEALDIFRRARDASLRAKKRGEEKDIWRYDGADIDIIRTALAIHDQQIAQVTQGRMVKVINDVRARVERGDVINRVAA